MSNGEIIARLKRIEKALGIPNDLPPMCDVEGCNNEPTYTFSSGFPAMITTRRCDAHPLGGGGASAGSSD